MTDAWHRAQIDGVGNASNWEQKEHFDYDELGNRKGNANETMSRGGGLNFSVRNNGLNQYSSWSASVIYHDDNYPGLGPLGNGDLKGVRAKY